MSARPSMILSIVKKSMLLLGTSLICLALAEVFLRIYLPDYTNVYTLDPVYLHRLVPNSAKIYIHHKNNGGGSVPVQINSMGFRDHEFSPSAAGTGKRVVVYGDSFIEAEFTPLEESFTKQLERDLQKGSEQPVQVINAGVVAYGPDQIDLRIGNETESLKPDLVIVSIFTGNDFGDLLRDKIYRLNSNNQLIENRPVFSNSLKAEFERPRFKLVAVIKKIVKGRLKSMIDPTGIEFSNRANYIERSLLLCAADYEDNVLRNNNEVKNLLGDQYDADIASDSDMPAPQYKIRLMEQVILSIRRKLDARRIPFVLLIIPAVIDTCPTYVRVDMSILPKFSPTVLTHTVEEIASRNGIKYLNLYDEFRSRGGCQLYFNYPNGHWNTEGQTLTAQLLSDLIASEHLLNRQYQTNHY